MGGGLPTGRAPAPAVQRALLGVVAWSSRPGLARRRAPLPEPGAMRYLTTVVRLPELDLPPIALDARHLRYPPATVHVTVANVDAARVPLEVAVARLARRPLPVARFRLDGLAVSPDTVFVRCTYDGAFAALRRAVAEAFDLPPRRSPLAIPYRWTAYANVVRFEGAGTWVADRRPTGVVEGTVLEVVRADRLLSDEGTTVLAALPLTARVADAPDGRVSG